MIRFSIGGQAVEPENLEDALMAAVLKEMREKLRQQVGSIRDPDTGEFPTVIVRGDSINNLTLHVEGSEKLVALVKEKLGLDDTDQAANRQESSETPKVFLSYTSDDLELARRIAESLMAAGIDTWWDKWCIYPGDSLRQKIDEGLTDCTHFLVLLTPQSIDKPWVNAEMDAALVQKLDNRCKFLPVRHDLPVSDLPPSLKALASPTVTTDEEITQLINDIYGVSRKPPLGSPPETVAEARQTDTGYSPAATAVTRLFVERSEHGLFADPRFSVGELARETGLSIEDTEDALYELAAFVEMSPERGEVADQGVFVKGSCFAEFDCHWKPWKPAEDARQLAADLVNDPEFLRDPEKIAERYGWKPRRLNPAISYLLEQELIEDLQEQGTGPYAVSVMIPNGQTRRFVRSRR